jgi:urea transporter
MISVSGMVFSEAPYDTVYDGIWGFNGILSAIAVGGLFFVLTCHSFGTALASVLFTVLVQQAFALAFAPVSILFVLLININSSFAAYTTISCVAYTTFYENNCLNFNLNYFINLCGCHAL